MRPTVAAVLLPLVSIIAIAPACGFRDTTVHVNFTTLKPASGPTSAAPTTEDLCSTLSQADIVAAGYDANLSAGADAGAFYAIGSDGDESACQWFVSHADDTFTLTLAVSAGVDPTVFDRILAQPVAQKGAPIPELGERAVYVAVPPGLSGPKSQNFVLAYDKGRVIKLDCQDATQIGRDPLLALAAMIIPRLK